MTVLAFRGVRHLYGRKVALEDFTLEVGKAQVVALLGPSGSGKTTALRIAAGLETPESGEVFVNGRMVAGPGVFVPPERRDIGLLFQDLALFPHLTVRRNIAFALDVKKWPRAAMEERTAELAALLGLEALLDRAITGLSGGERQRVALARALAARPPVLLLDEPLSALDAAGREHLRAGIQSIRRQEGVTILHVTHDAADATALGTEVIPF